MRVYLGLRSLTGCNVYVWDTWHPARPQPLDPSRELWLHGTDVMEWGSNTPGALQLAMSMLYDATDDVDFAVTMGPDVRDALVASLPADIWARTELDVLDCAFRQARTSEAVRLATAYLEAVKKRREKGGNGHVLII